MNCNTTHYRANSSSVPGDPTDYVYFDSTSTVLKGSLAAALALGANGDLFLSVGSASFTNSHATPETSSTGTVGRLGARLHWTFGSASVGVVGALLYASPLPRAGTGLGAGGWLVASYDLSRSGGPPLVLHGSFGGRYDPGSTVSYRRLGLWPTTVLGLWRYDVADVALAIDVPLGKVTPFVEYSVETPFGSGAPISAAPHRVTPGVRVGLGSGVFLSLGLELGLSAVTAEGVPVAAPFFLRAVVGWGGAGALVEAPPEVAVAKTETTPPPPPPVDPIKAIDPDGDGLFGPADLCPAQAGPASNDGCPLPDGDKDGVPDRDDQCPKVAGLKERKGCPAAVDTDGDGLDDDVDQCPKAPGARDHGGCPEYKQIIVTQTKIELKQKIYFAFGKTTILPKSFPLLDEVVEALNDRPTLCVRVEGHTDKVGNEQQNLQLSQGRSDAVRSYLSEHDIEATRTQAKGYGSQLPLETNATVEGREANRRVEFVLVPCDGKGK